MTEISPLVDEYCLLWMNWWPMCMTRSEWSGWVQAFGSIAAILGGFFAVWWQTNEQHKVQRADQINEEFRFLRIVGQFVFEVRAKIRMIEEEDLPYTYNEWQSIEIPIACIKAIPFDRYPVDTVAFAVSAALLSYNFLTSVAWKPRARSYSEEEISRIDKARQYALAHFFKAELFIDNALNQRNSKINPMEITFPSGFVMRTLEPNPV